MGGEGKKREVTLAYGTRKESRPPLAAKGGNRRASEFKKSEKRFYASCEGFGGGVARLLSESKKEEYGHLLESKIKVARLVPLDRRGRKK